MNLVRWLAVYSSLIGLVAACDRVWGLDDLVAQPRGDGGMADSGPDAPRPDGEPMGCPASYDHILQTTASRYRVVLSHRQWVSAANDCAGDAPGLTHMLVLSNQGEHDAMLTVAPALPMWLYDDTWLGATDLVTRNSTFRWVTSEVTGYVVPAALGTLPWEPDQPDATGQCAQMRITGAVHDKDCTSAANYICECDGRPNDPTAYQ
jgi:hypothetical protein